MQARPLIFDLQIRVPDVLYEEVVEVDEEVLLPLGTEPDRCTSSVKSVHGHRHSQAAAHASIYYSRRRPTQSMHAKHLCSGERTLCCKLLMVRVVCRRSGQHPKEDEQAYAPGGERRETVTGEMVCMRRKVDLDALRADLQASAFSSRALRPVPLVVVFSGQYSQYQCSQRAMVACGGAP